MGNSGSRAITSQNPKRNAEFIPQPKGDMNIALQNLRDCDSFLSVTL